MGIVKAFLGKDRVYHQRFYSQTGVGGGKKAQEGGDICISMIYVDVWQKSTQYCIILQ